MEGEDNDLCWDTVRGEGLRKTTRNLMIACLLADIRTLGLPNTDRKYQPLNHDVRL
jgi:hypothetical protein